MKTTRSRFFLITLAIAAAAGAAIWHRARPAPVTNSHPTGSRIIALGDSLTAGVGASAGRDYVSVLSRKIGRPIVNRGVSGDTTTNALNRLDGDVLAHDPQIVIVFLGGNDMLLKIPAGQTFANLDRIVARIHEKGAMVVLVELRPPAGGGKYRRGFKQLARERGVVLVPNIFRDIFSDPRMKADQIHFNDRGYSEVAERIYDAMRPYLPGKPGTDYLPPRQ